MQHSSSKRIERRLRRVLLRVLARSSRRARRSGTIELPQSPRILLLRHDRFGDAIVSTPIAKLLRERYEGARIDIVLGHRNASIASLLPAIDTVHIAGRGITGLRAIVPVLRAQRYDVVVNLLAKDSTSGAYLAIASRARLRIGFDGELASVYDFAVPRPERAMHIVPQTALLLAPFGIDAMGDRPTRESEMLELRVLRSASTQERPDRDAVRIVFSISARDAVHTWPDDNVVELVRRTAKSGITWSIAGTVAHADRVRAIADASGADAVPQTGSFAEFVAQLAAFDMIITPQTSTVHIGSALRTPTILLNTDSESDRQWTPWGVEHRVLCGGDRLELIAVDEVAHAIESLRSTL